MPVRSGGSPSRDAGEWISVSCTLLTTKSGLTRHGHMRLLLLLPSFIRRPRPMLDRSKISTLALGRWITVLLRSRRTYQSLQPLYYRVCCSPTESPTPYRRCRMRSCSYLKYRTRGNVAFQSSISDLLTSTDDLRLLSRSTRWLCRLTCAGMGAIMAS